MAGAIRTEKNGAAEHKRELRAEIRRREAALPEEYLKASGAAICERLWELPEFQKAGTVFVFVGCGAEIDTSDLIERMLSAGKRVLVPRCEAKGIMHAYEIKSLSELSPGSYGIPEPSGGAKKADPAEIGFCIVPCLSCDREGYRLGHGGGYYDRYLEQVHVPRTVICRERLMLDSVPHEAHDLRMNLVVTETQICTIKY